MVILCSLTKVVIFRFFSKRKDESAHNFISMEMHFRFCMHGLAVCHWCENESCKSH